MLCLLSRCRSLPARRCRRKCATGTILKAFINTIHEMEHARSANHHDMEGHGARAEEHLRAAERELGLAIDAARASAK